MIRHFAWMQEHGIDGAFLQRFISSLAHGAALAANNTVLENVRAGARRHGASTRSCMTSAASNPAGRPVDQRLEKLLRDTRLTSDPAYLHHRGKPLLALWGCGFHDEDDKPRPTLEDWRKIILFSRRTR